MSLINPDPLRRDASVPTAASYERYLAPIGGSSLFVLPIIGSRRAQRELRARAVPLQAKFNS